MSIYMHIYFHYFLFAYMQILSTDSQVEAMLEGAVSAAMRRNQPSHHTTHGHR